MTLNFTPAPLDDPLYYLRNFEWVLGWVRQRYGDLLPTAELDFIDRALALPDASRGLLVRMVMRKGELFRPDTLEYPELGPYPGAAVPLQQAGWLQEDPEVSLEALFRLFTWPTLKAALRDTLEARHIPLASRKGEALDALLAEPEAEDLAPKPASSWGLPAQSLVRLTVMPQCDRLRWLFFGNGYQDWSEFVLTELGLYRYEPVTFDERSRPVHRRTELETFWQLLECRQQWHEDESPEMVLEQLPPEPEGQPWLARHYHRLLFKLARHWERTGELERARDSYQRSSYPGARGRRLRVLERLGHHETAFELAQAAQQAPESEAERQQLERLLPRLKRTLTGERQRRAAPPEVPEVHLSLPQDSSVERAVAAHLSTPETPVYYAENTLLTGLFGLLMWDAIFEPLPGAFFHPFQRGPADLYWPDFVERRADRFDALMAKLTTGAYRQTILDNFERKAGRQSPFVAWGALDQAQLTQALECIPAEHLALCFQRFLQDLKANCAGLPDLIQFWPDERRYHLLEVKGPGDRLQDNQKRWLAFFRQHQMPVSVCYVRWSESADD